MLAFGMPETLSRARVADVAALANLDLTDDELELFGRQLTEILAYVAALDEVDTSGVPATAAVSAGEASDRADEIQPSIPRDEALAMAPDPAPDAGLFKVPRVIG
jgi:aspartyl-tRNA(Asn)/glutamyl-tRNA(Gln) amidotransferase subunit C